LATSMHTGNEAGWITILQAHVLDLRWLVSPGSVPSALITGMFGIQPEPTIGEVIVWLAFALPMLALVLRPARAPSAVPAG
jgi:high-affinity iron transporter